MNLHLPFNTDNLKLYNSYKFPLTGGVSAKAWGDLFFHFHVFFFCYAWSLKPRPCSGIGQWSVTLWGVRGSILVNGKIDQWNWKTNIGIKHQFVMNSPMAIKTGHGPFGTNQADVLSQLWTWKWNESQVKTQSISVIHWEMGILSGGGIQFVRRSLPGIRTFTVRVVAKVLESDGFFMLELQQPDILLCWFEVSQICVVLYKLYSFSVFWKK